MFLLTILRHTPLWVWVLLAFIVSRGIAAMRPRDVSPSRIIIVPAVFLIWGLSGLLGASESHALNPALFLVAAAVGLGIGRALASLSPAPRLIPEAGLIAMPGSPVTLILICLAFAIKYAGGVAMAISTDPAEHAWLASGMAAVGGLFAGIFWGRTLGQFQRALEASGAPSNPAAILQLALGRSGGAVTKSP